MVSTPFLPVNSRSFWRWPHHSSGMSCMKIPSPQYPSLGFCINNSRQPMWWFLKGFFPWIYTPIYLGKWSNFTIYYNVSDGWHENTTWKSNSLNLKPTVRAKNNDKKQPNNAFNRFSPPQLPEVLPDPNIQRLHLGSRFHRVLESWRRRHWFE